MGGKRITNAKLVGAAAPAPAKGSEAPTKPSRTCLHRQLHKTRLCVYHSRGTCQYGSNCSFAHTQTDLSTAPDLQRTRLCLAFAEGQCNNPSCTFAHGESELRSTDMFYKKAMCIWHEKGKCRNGQFCRFAHGSAELHCTKDPGQGKSPETPEQLNAQAQISATEFVEKQIATQHALAANAARATQAAQAAQAAQIQQFQQFQHLSSAPQHTAFVSSQVAARKAAVDELGLPQQWAAHHQHFPGAQQLAVQQQLLRDEAWRREMVPPTSGEPMKITQTSLTQPAQAQWAEPPAPAPQGLANVSQELAALGELAVQLHRAGTSAPQPAAPAGPAPHSSAATGPAAGTAAGALAALAALQDLNLASHLASAQRHGNADLQGELGKLCESISSLSVQCNKLQRQVQSQLHDGPSAASASTTAEELPAWGGFSRNVSESDGWSQEGFSRQVSMEGATGIPVVNLGNSDARDAAAQWAAALRLVTGLQQL